ncbi:MAG: PEP-CTERM sorting domain-containing protein [Pirellulales bacterium]|nr:PEP-CTERM sorting domain-containing protein [Pirellulales bacterium]
MKLLRVWLAVMVCAVAIGVANQAPAETIAVELGSTYTMGANYAFSLGWNFTPTEDIIVTHLGLIDALQDGVDNIVDGGQTVALYEWYAGEDNPTAGQRLRVATVPTTATMESAGSLPAYYVEIDPITLTAGTEYMVAARVKKRDYVYLVSFVNDESKAFTRVSGHATPSAGPPDMPLYGNDATFTIGPTIETNYYGGTFKYVPVPEPSTLWLLATGVVALMAWRRRR